MCILDANGGTVNCFSVNGPCAGVVVDRLRQLGQRFSLCCETPCGYGHLYEQVRP
jgi:hypothetical protein